MQIFFLSTQPLFCARQYCDQHVIKMILETTQLLWSVWHHALGSSRKDDKLLAWWRTQYGADAAFVPYKLTHANHPCAVWARACEANYTWLCNLGLALCREHEHRKSLGMGKAMAGGVYKHKCQPQLAWLRAVRCPLFSCGTPTSGCGRADHTHCCITPPPMAMDDMHKVKCTTDKEAWRDQLTRVIKSYQNLYRAKARDFGRWNYTNKPEWI